MMTVNKVMNSLRRTGQSFKKEKNIFQGSESQSPNCVDPSLTSMCSKKKRKRGLGKNSDSLWALCLGDCDPLSRTSTTGEKCSFTSLEMTTELKSFISRGGRISLGKEVKIYSHVS